MKTFKFILKFCFLFEVSSPAIFTPVKISKIPLSPTLFIPIYFEKFQFPPVSLSSKIQSPHLHKGMGKPLLFFKQLMS